MDLIDKVKALFPEPEKPEAWRPTEDFMKYTFPNGVARTKPQLRKLERITAKRNEERNAEYSRLHSHWQQLADIADIISHKLPTSLSHFFEAIYDGQSKLHDELVAKKKQLLEELDAKYPSFDDPHSYSEPKTKLKMSAYYSYIPNHVIVRKWSNAVNAPNGGYEYTIPGWYSTNSSTTLVVVKEAESHGNTLEQIYADCMKVFEDTKLLRQLGSKTQHMEYVLFHLKHVLDMIYATGENRWPKNCMPTSEFDVASFGYGGHFNGLLDYGDFKASFKSFLAGGWNIQRLHVRFRITRLSH